MKKLYLLLIFSLSLFASNTDKKIINKQSALKYQKIEKSKMNQKLDSLILALNKQKTILNNIDKEIDSLNKEVKALQKELSLKNNNIQLLKKSQKELLAKKEEIQKSILDYFSHNYYLSQSKVVSTEDLINEEVVRAVTNITKKRVAKITKEYIELNQKSKSLSEKIALLIHKKLSLQAKKREILSLKKSHQKELALLNQKVKNYKKILQDIINRERQFQNELAKLKLIKQAEIKRQRELERQRELKRQREIARQKALAKQKALKKQNIAKVDKSKVKKYGSSYMRSRVRSYRGKKTIPPIKHGVITKSFGNYVDPVYKIKVYNDSITLKAPRKDALVRAIFNGRVVFVGESSNKLMVVVRHRNGLYSIYANLIKISPYIKKGYRIKKGDIIARVKDELIFEITYRDIPINPLDVIKL